MDTPILVTAYYVQNLIQLLGPKHASKILENLRHETIFDEVDQNLEQLSKKVARDGKRVNIGVSILDKGVDIVCEKTDLILDKTVMEKTSTKSLGKSMFTKTKAMVKKMGTKTVVGIVGKKVPGVSVGVGTGLALWRILEQPNSEEVWIKAGAEVASGVASCFPGAGTAVSLTIDGILVASDFHDAKKLQDEDGVGDNDENSIDKTQKSKSKKQKQQLPSLYTFSIQGSNVCDVAKCQPATCRFRIPENFEIWFFCDDDSPMNSTIFFDALLYSILTKESAQYKVNYTDSINPAAFCRKLTTGQMCPDYRVSLSEDYEKIRDNDLWQSFHLGLTKWLPKFDKNPTVITPVETEDDEDCKKYFTLSQIVCDLGRKENSIQKCVLLFLCNLCSNLVSEEPEFNEKVDAWKDHIKRLFPSPPTKDDHETNN